MSRGKVFSREDSFTEEFWTYGEGAMVWDEDNGVPVLTVILPGKHTHKKDGRTWGLHSLLMVNNGKDWTTPGDKTMWDGNRDAPTLSGSVSIPDHWHGWIRSGKLEDASDSPAKTPEA